MTMSRVDIESGIRSVAATHLTEVPELDAEARLVEDLDLDSLEILTLSFEIENHFDIILEPDDEQAIVTVGDLADTIERLLAQPRATGADVSR